MQVMQKENCNTIRDNSWKEILDGQLLLFLYLWLWGARAYAFLAGAQTDKAQNQSCKGKNTIIK